jgi:leucyl aminopeptidase
MDIAIRGGNPAARVAGALALGMFQNERRLSGAAAEVNRATGGALAALLRSGDFSGRWLECVVLHPARGRVKRVIVVGLGEPEAFDAHRARQAFALVARRARDLRAGVLAIVTPAATRGGPEAQPLVQALAEGVALGHHRFSAYRTQPDPPPLKRVEIVERETKNAKAMAGAVARGARIGEAVCLARDLASTPGQDLTPEGLASRAREIARGAGATVRVLDVPQMERLGMGALLAVGRGSVHPPRFIVLERKPKRARGAKAPRTLVAIGKGVTFDTGGISLKPRENMHKMKYDMSGAAAVLGMFAALPAIETPFRIVGLIPAAENMPGGRALKPGDVVRALDGTTIEVTNTDAEGRLVLADALGYARRFGAEAVVDLATLTGAISIALGHLAAGLFTTEERLARELEQAGLATGERLWRLPLWDEYAPELRSDTADMVNSAAREGGAILGAMFLRHFARGMAWAHLDIASTAWIPNERAHEGRGPTGFGVRLLLEWIRRRAIPSTSSAS